MSGRFLSVMRKNTQRFIHDNRGVAYIEFALALPFLLLLFAGSIDVTRMVLLHQKVDKAVFTVGDLATQLNAESGVCSIVAGWENTVVRDMIRPFDYSPANFTFVMSSVLGTHPNGSPNGAIRDRIEWRYNAGNPSIIGDTYTGPYNQQANLPASISNLATDERVIVTEMRYMFQPLLPVLSKLTPKEFVKASYFRSRVTTGREGRSSGVLSGC